MKKVSLAKINSKKLNWLNTVLKLLVIFVIWFLIFRVFIGFSAISGDSMSPNLVNGENVLYLRTAHDYKQGDVISLWVPSGNYYVKRVIAVGGDVVDIHDGKVFVNGEELEDEYAVGETNKQEGAVIYPYTVREGNVFVLGDNREVSIDSRTFGEVNSRQIRGKIILHFGRWYVDML